MTSRAQRHHPERPRLRRRRQRHLDRLPGQDRARPHRRAVQRRRPGRAQRRDARRPPPHLRAVRQRDVRARRQHPPLALHAAQPAADAEGGRRATGARRHGCPCPDQHRPPGAGDHAVPGRGQPPARASSRRRPPRELRHGHRRDDVGLARLTATPWSSRAISKTRPSSSRKLRHVRDLKLEQLRDLLAALPETDAVGPRAPDLLRSRRDRDLCPRLHPPGRPGAPRRRCLPRHAARPGRHGRLRGRPGRAARRVARLPPVHHLEHHDLQERADSPGRASVRRRRREAWPAARLHEPPRRRAVRHRGPATPPALHRPVQRHERLAAGLPRRPVRRRRSALRHRGRRPTRSPRRQPPRPARDRHPIGGSPSRTATAAAIRTSSATSTCETA